MHIIRRYEMAKMKTIKFSRPCKDKDTKRQYITGEVVEFKEARANEIIGKGYAEEFVEPAVPEPVEEATAQEAFSGEE